ncbi:pseudaminic acid cytidylyltransferase [Pseudomonas gingeri]|uniref:pseudaminic acid cytidylyltransferase n=1 Tax=Pseudomonas TaxID=286 RepID=UPI0015BDDF4E|nr:MULTISPECIES: pseudaminic acid cytidylyltransferase [Pseudomonas]NWE68149.1 pseudaminic acid cytidylyltransferase [Pseudomonas gingeri]BBP79423.1 pseudaminic acid cytidylyltransferase [Pseudomonas sp. Ost2]
MNVAVIPARGGSKRIPRKNIKMFCGRPMIAWSILAARQSGLFERIIVSTDDEEIAEMARTWGAETPFVRPPELSDDYAGTTEVIAHATRWLQDQGVPVTAVCCIYATAPLIRAEDLVHGLKVLQSGDWAYAFSVAEFSPSVYRAFQASAQGGLSMLFPEFFSTRSQDLPVALHDAGQFYWGRADAWVQGLRVFDRHSMPVCIPRWRVQDIDDMDDWIRAEMIFKQLMSDQRQ